MQSKSQNKYIFTNIARLMSLSKTCAVKVIILLFLLVSSKTTFAQYDTIKYVNGIRQAAKIVEITDKYVKFKNPRDTLGPTFTVPIKQVEQFILKSGCIDLRDKGYENCVKDPTYGVIKNEDFTRTIIGLDFLQAFDQHFHISLDHLFKNRKCGFGVYYDYGFSDGTDITTYTRLESKVIGGNYYKNDYFGFDFKIFPSFHKKFTHFISLGMEIGSVANTYTIYDTTFINNGSGYHNYSLANPRVQFQDKKYFGYHLNNGFLWRIKKHFTCQGILSLGLNQFENDLRQKTISKQYVFGLKIGAGLVFGIAF